MLSCGPKDWFTFYSKNRVISLLFHGNSQLNEVNAYKKAMIILEYNDILERRNLGLMVSNCFTDCFSELSYHSKHIII